ncbi:transcription factor ACEII [Aspergillus udagawae]|nr:transcription factor ACEII [Aspergillus udagawae]
MPSQPLLSHVGVIVNPSARRVACDQCHAQKLRCTKLENCTVCVRCQRLNRQCIWSPPSRSGRPARTTVEEKVVKRGGSRLDNAGEKRRKRSLSVLESTQGEGSPESAREPVHTSQISTQPTPPAIEMAETVPSLPSSFADWNMSDIFSLSSPRYSSRENPLPSLWAPESVPPLPNSTDYFQMPSMGNQTRTTQDTPAMPPTCAPQRLASLQDITRELSNINLSLFNLEQSLHAEPWGPMFASPAAVISKLSTCGGDQPDNTLAQGYPLIDIFSKTQHFIDIAKQTSVYFAPLPTPLMSRPTPTGEAPSHALYPDSDTSSQASSRSSQVDMYMQHEMPPPASSSTVRGDPSSPDLPTALLFTSGYAQILNLYTTVSTQISHFVHALSVQSMAGGPDYRQRMHPVIPPLQWGGFQPANYGALQILMAIQVISYLLTEVERALGVDEWEREVMRERIRSEERGRPSSCSGGEEGGFYSDGQKHASSRPGNRAAVGSGLLSAAMIEIVAQGEGPRNRRGKVGLLRRKLKKLKKELEKSMHS